MTAASHAGRSRRGSPGRSWLRVRPAPARGGAEGIPTQPPTTCSNVERRPANPPASTNSSNCSTCSSTSTTTLLAHHANLPPRRARASRSGLHPARCRESLPACRRGQQYVTCCRAGPGALGQCGAGGWVRDRRAHGPSRERRTPPARTAGRAGQTARLLSTEEHASGRPTLPAGPRSERHAVASIARDWHDRAQEIGAPGGIRTHTGGGLSSVALPVGLRGLSRRPESGRGASERTRYANDAIAQWRAGGSQPMVQVGAGRREGFWP